MGGPNPIPPGNTGGSAGAETPAVTKGQSHRTAKQDGGPETGSRTISVEHGKVKLRPPSRLHSLLAISCQIHERRAVGRRIFGQKRAPPIFSNSNENTTVLIGWTTMRKRASLFGLTLSTEILACTPGWLPAQTGSVNEPIRYVGGG